MENEDDYRDTFYDKVLKGKIQEVLMYLDTNESDIQQQNASDIDAISKRTVKRFIKEFGEPGSIRDHHFLIWMVY